MHPIIQVASQAARAAGKIVHRSINTEKDITITEKHTNDYVTNIDIEIEECLLHHLQKAYPTHSFLTEETGEIHGEDTDHVWVIDPLDGTTNFIHGFGHYAISIALQIHGVSQYAVIYNPATDELYTAVKGKGAQLNGKRLRVTNQASFEGSLIAPSMPRSGRYKDSYGNLLQAISKEVAGVRYTGSVALDLAYIAAGQLDGMWRVGIKPWDSAAGLLLVREAGGVVMDLNGGTDVSSGDIIAAAPKMAKPIITLLKGHIEPNTH